MQVTISLLPVSLSLVRIPRSRLPTLSHPLLRQILKPNHSFLNITCNELELSVFAENDLLEDFVPIAKKDKHKLLISRSRPSSRRSISVDYECVELSYDTWNVLQIDSHSDALDNSGARIHELSAPLAAAGISIFYLSSYTSDFIFVKSTRIHKVISLMSAAGFHLYSPDLPISMSPALSPLPPDSRLSPIDFLHEPSFPATAEAITTQSRSALDLATTNSLFRSALIDPSDTESEEGGDNLTSRSKSHPPSASQVTVLSPDLTCVGLSDDSAHVWALKIVKLVAFPELIPAPASSRKNSTSSTSSSSYSQPQSPSFDFDGALSNGTLIPLTESSSDEEESDDDHEQCSSSDTDPNQPPSPRSAPDIFSSGLASMSTTPSKDHRLRHHQGSSSRRNWDTRSTAGGHHPAVPFYSFTRTPEGSSLTTDVTLLASLFPPSERHMVICSDELDNVSMGEQVPKSERVDRNVYDEQDMNQQFTNDDDDEGVQLSGTLKCLQIDLRKFGLDKHGLVNRYSQVLHENGINHMYSSTFKTANLLVNKVHAHRAQELLRAC